MTFAPEHIIAMASASLAERRMYQIIASSAEYRVISVDPLQEVVAAGTRDECELWLECKGIRAALKARG